MDKREKALYEARAQVLKALAHPSRLFIVDELSRGARCVHELTDLIGTDMSTVSRHLKVMREAGIIYADREGTRIRYFLQIPCVLNFFHCIESVIKEQAKKQMELVK